MNDVPQINQKYFKGQICFFLTRCARTNVLDIYFPHSKTFPLLLTSLNYYPLKALKSKLL